MERPSGRLAEAAGLDSTLVYVSYESLEENGKSNGINHYEIVMPNPVSGFAENYIRENLGADEKETEVLENTSRYSFLSRCQQKVPPYAHGIRRNAGLVCGDRHLAVRAVRIRPEPGAGILR